MALFLNERDVSELLSVAECIEVLERAFKEEGQGLAENTPRSRIRLPKGFLHFMPAAWIGSSVFGYKAYTSFPSGGKSIVMLYDGDTGELLCLLEANILGRIRTGAATGLATKHMARHDSTVVGIIGSGSQAQTQLEAVCAIREIKGVRVYSRTFEKRDAFATQMRERLRIAVTPVESGEECIRGADIAITITDAREPVLKGEWLMEGTHINAAGGNHWMRREIDGRAVELAGPIVVDDLEQAKVECGDLIWPSQRGSFRWSQAHELRDVLAGLVNGRPNDTAITLFESQGVDLEDIAAAHHIYQKAKEQGLGVELPF